jgi:type I restriction enzyme M protein
MVFSAHVPHPKGKKTWFGYWKDDGLIKVKNKGRIDVKEKWSEIKKYWVNSYLNKEVIAGYSITKEVSAEDEWCAEAYMETDYSGLNQNMFMPVIKNYIAFQFLNN